MRMWKGLIVLGLLLVGCSSDPPVNQATHDRAVAELRAEIHAARDLLKDQTAINTSLTEKNEELEANHTEAQKKIADLEVRLDAIKNERTRFVSGEATSLVIYKLTENLLYKDNNTSIGYLDVMDDLGFVGDERYKWRDHLRQRCALLQKEITFGNSRKKFAETYIDNGVWEVSLSLKLPAYGNYAKAIPNFQFKWRVYEKTNTVIALHNQQGQPIC